MHHEHEALGQPLSDQEMKNMLRDHRVGMSPDRTMSELEIAQQNLLEAITSVEKQVGELAEQLRPVLRPPVERDMADKVLEEAPVPVSPHTEFLQVQTARLNRLAVQIENGADRLAV